MVTGRVHRMTELFGRLAPGADLEPARAELRAAHGAIIKEHPESYSPKADFRIDAVRLRDQIVSPARTVLLVLLAASALVFIIACSNVANLILARSVRREGELAIRAALGASTGALRRTLLAESLLLCGAGAILGVLIARPMVAILSRYAARFSVRALDLTVDSSLLWVGVGLAVAAAVLLAFVPRLPSAEASTGLGLSSGSVRITSGTNRRLRLFAVTQIAASFVLLAGAGMLLTTLLALQTTQTGFNIAERARPERAGDVVRPHARSDRRVLQGGHAAHHGVAWCRARRRRHGRPVARRRRVRSGIRVFRPKGTCSADGEEDPRARFRTVSPGFFAALGVPIIAGRDFTDADRRGAERVVIISQSVAQRMFPTQDAVNRRMTWADPVMKFIDVSTEPRRIVGIAADMDDENVVPGAAMSVYHPFEQEIGGGRLFVHAKTDPYTLVTPIRRIIRELSADQPVERAATLDGRARGSTGARPLERDGLRRFRNGRVDDCGGRRGGCAGVLGQCADARVRHQARDWIRATSSADACARRGRRHCGRRYRGRRHWRRAAGALRRRLHSGHPNSWRAAGHRRRRDSRRCGDHRVA